MVESHQEEHLRLEVPVAGGIGAEAEIQVLVQEGRRDTGGRALDHLELRLGKVRLRVLTMPSRKATEVLPNAS